MNTTVFWNLNKTTRCYVTQHDNPLLTYIFLLYLAMLSLSVTLQSSFAFRRDLVPRPSAKSENPRIDRHHQKKKLAFLVFFFPFAETP